MMKLQSRNHGLDLLRVLACYMVLQVHAGEFYYLSLIHISEPTRRS